MENDAACGLVATWSAGMEFHSILPASAHTPNLEVTAHPDSARFGQRGVRRWATPNMVQGKGADEEVTCSFRARNWGKHLPAFTFWRWFFSLVTIQTSLIRWPAFLRRLYLEGESDKDLTAIMQLRVHFCAFIYKMITSVPGEPAVRNYFV